MPEESWDGNSKIALLVQNYWQLFNDQSSGKQINSSHIYFAMSVSQLNNQGPRTKSTSLGTEAPGGPQPPALH